MSLNRYVTGYASKETKPKKIPRYLPEMARRQRWLAGLASWMQNLGLLGPTGARGRGEADGVDAEILGWSQLREWLAGDVVWEVVAGVEDANGDLARESKKEGHHEMRQNKGDIMEQTGKVDEAYSCRNRRDTAASARRSARNGGGLGAWGGVRCAGNERGCRRLLIGADMVGDRAIMAGIGFSPAYRRRDGRGRDLGKKGRKGSGACRW